MSAAVLALVTRQSVGIPLFAQDPGVHVHLFLQFVDFDLQPLQGLPQLVKRLTPLPQETGSDPDTTGSGRECRSAEQQGTDHGQAGR